MGLGVAPLRSALTVSWVGYVHTIRGDTGIEQYVHRIGRTARGTAVPGVAVSYFDRHVDGPNAGCLCKLMEEAGQTPPPQLSAIAEKNAENKTAEKRLQAEQLSLEMGNYLN